jgi:hypothetical protein
MAWGCASRPSACPCFQRLTGAASCAALGGKDLGFPAVRSFRGRFVTPAGPLAGGNIALEQEGKEGPRPRLLSTGPDGRFDAGPLEAGDYRFVVCRPGRPGASGWVAIAPGGPDVPLEFEIPE